jgi:FlaG/FlaF family flagellin (archaellin)
MSRLKSLVTTIVLAGTVAAAGHAQAAPATPPTPQQQAAALTQKMTAQLKLTPAQVPQVSQINTAALTTISEIKAKGGRTLKEDKSLKSAMDDWNTGLKGVLTGEQYTGWQQMQQAMKDQKQ